jgi:anti-anti-sigma factor
MRKLIEVKSQNDVALIICKKEFAEEKTGQELRSITGSLLDEGHCKTFLVDISGVRRMNSMFLGALVGASRQAQEHDCRFVVCGMQQTVKSVLHIMRGLLPWDVMDDCKEARSTFGFG